MTTIYIRPMSVNDAWKGRRFKTDRYKVYISNLLLMLPLIKNFPEPPYKIYLKFGQSTVLADWDNPIKPFCDILQTKYAFNDRDIMSAIVDKEIVPKGKEYCSFLIESL